MTTGTTNLSKEHLRVRKLRKISSNMEEMADWIEKCAEVLDDDGHECKCCGAFRYRSFAQHILHEKVVGVANRLRDIAETFSSRATDPEFADGRGEEVK